MRKAIILAFVLMAAWVKGAGLGPPIQHTPLTTNDIYGYVPSVNVGPWTWMNLEMVSHEGTNAATLSPNGNDATAQLGNPALPYRTMSNAVTALNALPESTVKFLFLGCGDYTNSTEIGLDPNFRVFGVERHAAKLWFVSSASALRFRSGTMLANFQIEVTVTNDYTFPLGTFGSSASKNCLLLNLDVISTTDCIYSIGGAYLDGVADFRIWVTVIGCRFRNKWDNVYVEASSELGDGAALTSWKFFDCLFWAVGPSIAQSVGRVGNVKLTGQGAYAEFHRCTFLSSGATNEVTGLQIIHGARALDNGNKFVITTNGAVSWAAILNTNISATSVLISQNSTVTNAANLLRGNGTVVINRTKSQSWP